MANFILSAFADEVSPLLDVQLAYLNKMEVGYIEPRNVNGTNISSLTLDEAKEAKAKMDKHGIKVSSIGSPIGKIKTTDDFAEQLKLFENTLDIADIMETKNIRIFSFYFAAGIKPEDHRSIVMDRLGQFLKIAEKRNIVLCHENEKGIYGETPENCLDIMKEFDGKIKSVFDNANFAFCFHEAYPKGVDLLLPYLQYAHIKDADAEGVIVPAGKGAGKVPETLKAINKAYNGDFLLTVEPHLNIFSGLEKLSNLDELKVKNVYGTPEEAFNTAINATRDILASL